MPCELNRSWLLRNRGKIYVSRCQGKEILNNPQTGACTHVKGCYKYLNQTWAIDQEFWALENVIHESLKIMLVK